MILHYLIMFMAITLAHSLNNTTWKHIMAMFNANRTIECISYIGYEGSTSKYQPCPMLVNQVIFDSALS